MRVVKDVLVVFYLRFDNDFVFPSINCQDIHSEIQEEIGEVSIPNQMKKQKVNTVIKASFGFGDVNACVIFRKYKD